MQHLKGISELLTWRAHLDANATLGFVPTMGALHAGHAALMRRAADCDRRIVSIFVNPLQFDRQADLDAYPATLAADLALCAQAGADAVFTTSKAEMYPHGFASQVTVAGLDKTLCGATRPGHFAGVTTVVTKLFNLVRPTHAYFGEKDFQQLTIIQRMVKDLNMPLQIIGVGTIRADDGLALSSRNRRLSTQQRAAAPAIWAGLRAAQAAFASGQQEAAELVAIARSVIAEGIAGARFDYLQVVDAATLAEVTRANSESVLATAVFLGEVRLIDHLRLGSAW